MRPLGSLTREQQERYWVVSKNAYCQTDPMPQMWIQDQGSGGTVKVSRIAADLCRKRCPVKRLCLAHALEAPELAGVWGGLLPSQRAGLLALWDEAGSPEERDLLLDNAETLFPIRRKPIPGLS